MERLLAEQYEREVAIWRAGVQEWQDADRFLARLAEVEGARGYPYSNDERLVVLTSWRDGEINYRAEQDRATGAAFRRLVESGRSFNIIHSPTVGATVQVHSQVAAPRHYAPTLPEAVFKALGPVGTTPDVG